jgi:hypothetical protein
VSLQQRHVAVQVAREALSVAAGEGADESSRAEAALREAEDAERREATGMAAAAAEAARRATDAARLDKLAGLAEAAAEHAKRSARTFRESLKEAAAEAEAEMQRFNVSYALRSAGDAAVDAGGAAVGLMRTLAPKELTVECWARLDAAPEEGARAGAVSTLSRDGAEGWFLGAEGGRWAFGVHAGAGTEEGARWAAALGPEGGARAGAGRWTHLAGTYDGDQAALYVDGEKVGASGAAAGRIAYPDPRSTSLLLLSVHGTGGAEGGGMVGAVDDVAVWGEALDAASVARHAAGRAATARALAAEASRLSEQLHAAADAGGVEAKDASRLIAYFPFGPGVTVPERMLDADDGGFRSEVRDATAHRLDGELAGEEGHLSFELQ